MTTSSSRPPPVPTGYAHPMYAASLAEFGTPRLLPHSAGWLLQRPIPAGGADAIGCYPLFACGNFPALADDWAALAGELVSVGLVPDPLTAPPAEQLHRLFDHVRLFKEHFLVRLAEADAAKLSKHHRYYARKALRSITVERAESPSAHLDEWCELYRTLVTRHRLNGIQAFSRKAFEIQLQTPGLVMLRAVENGVAVGAHLWFIDGERGYSHLMALSDRGYALSASYALYHEALFRSRELFGDGVAVLNLGGGAGSGPMPDDGLTVFKRGWSTGATNAYFCGKILNPAAYDQLVAGRSAQPDFFPAYRYVPST